MQKVDASEEAIKNSFTSKEASHHRTKIGFDLHKFSK
jgi:hypothetical protein